MRQETLFYPAFVGATATLAIVTVVELFL